MDSYNSEYNNILEDIEALTTGPEITGNTVVDAILNTDSVSSYRKKLTNTIYSAQAKNQIIKDKTLEKSYTIDGFEVLDVTFADGQVYFKIDDYHIELYTDFKDLAVEAKLEEALDAASIFYNKSETWIESEKL